MFSLLIYQQPPHKFCGTECSLGIHSNGLILGGKKKAREKGRKGQGKEERKKGGKKEGNKYAGGKLVK